MSAIYCPNCESANSRDAATCGMCGHSFVLGKPANSRLISLKAEKARLKQRLSEIQRDVIEGTHDPNAAIDTIQCPKCDRKIVPQWTYTGRKYLLVVEHFGIEGHGRSRFCPLCGVDVDLYIQELVATIKGIEKRISIVCLSPFQRLARCTPAFLGVFSLVILILLAGEVPFLAALIIAGVALFIGILLGVLVSKSPMAHKTDNRPK